MTAKARKNETVAEESQAPQKGILRDYVETILICVIFVIFSRAFVFQQSKIPSASMMDTLLVGDYIMVNRFVYSPFDFGWERSLLPQRAVRRGDVVVFKFPPEPEIDYIKRVVGMPGERVELRDGHLYVDGEFLDEPYVQEFYRTQDYNKNFAPIEVLPDHFFVLGDHRNASADGRVFGQVPQALMKGRALLIWWSFEEASSSGYVSTSERLKSWGVKARYFLSRSRWSRCFTLIL